ncbi:MAG: enoyl-CoA hydratase/isomerase family protein, partial [Pseudomonadota bacterium]
MTILEREVTGAVLRLNMNAPERLNALSDEMIAVLQEQFDALQTDTSIRAVILSGSGKAFCAGHDLKQMTAARQSEDGGAAAFKDLFDRCAHMMQSIL